MPVFEKVALIGASGSIGTIILNGLVASSKFTITVLTRDDSKAEFPEGFTVRKTDFSDPDDLEAALGGQDAVISTVGAAGLAGQRKIIDAAVRAGVKRFIPSEFSSNSLNDAVLELLPLFGEKREIIRYLESLQGGGLTWTAIATSGLFDWGLANAFLGFDVANRCATIWDGGSQRFTLTNEKTLVDAVVAVLEKNPKGAENEYICISTVEATQNEILRELAAATGEKWTVQETTTEEEVARGREMLGRGDFAGALMLVRATCFGDIPGLNANYMRDGDVANRLLGLKGEGVAETVKRVVNL